MEVRYYFNSVILCDKRPVFKAISYYEYIFIKCIIYIILYASGEKLGISLFQSDVLFQSISEGYFCKYYLSTQLNPHSIPETRAFIL